jgi:hypothetical protein
MIAAERYTWDSHHDGMLTKDYLEDAKVIESRCQHNFQTYDGNPLINRCDKCGSWHYKDSR